MYHPKRSNAVEKCRNPIIAQLRQILPNNNLVVKLAATVPNFVSMCCEFYKVLIENSLYLEHKSHQTRQQKWWSVKSVKKWRNIDNITRKSDNNSFLGYN